MDTFDIIEQQTEIPRRLKVAQDGFSRSDVINAFRDAFQVIGGTTRLALWANANPDKFFPLYAKLLPSTSFNFGDTGQQVIIHAIPPTALDAHPTPIQVETLPDG
jgi:hypothetical protein